jgi:hypothetical protein
VHGATDAPAVDVWARGVAKLVEGAQYGGITDYLAVPPAAYTLDIQPAGSASIVASFDADLSGLVGGAAAVIASGFLNPPADYADETAFALLAVLPDGTVLELPAAESDPTSQVQVIHNAADPAAASVDVYLGDALAIDDFGFRTATPFLDLPAGAEASIGIAPGTSSSVEDVIAEFPVTLQAGETYTVIATGVLDPGSFASHSEGADIGFTLWIKPMTRVAAEDPSSVEFFVTHGATDAPAVDVVARGVGPLVEGAAYGDITDYAAVPAGSYVLDIQPAGSEAIVASFLLDVSSLEGGAAAILASGFLDPSANQNGSAFGLIAVLPDGTVVQPAVVTSTEGATELPESFSVLGNYPNPFNPSTNIRFDLPVAATVSVQVFDILGRNVLATPPSNLSAGADQSIQIDAQSLSSGTYVYRVTATAGADEMVDSGRMLLVK